VSLKLIFDDPRHPDFELDLWLEGDQQRRESRSPADAIQEANRWLLRADAIVRRPLAPKAKPAPASEPAIQSRPPAVEPEPAPRPYTPALEAVSAAAPARPAATAPLFDEIDTTADPTEAPWDDDLDDDPPPIPEKVFKPVSKAAPKGDQDELPFDLDD
jgi:hypothetical protein